MPIQKPVITKKRHHLYGARKKPSGKIKTLPDPKSGKSDKRKRNRISKLLGAITGINKELASKSMSSEESAALKKRLKVLRKRLAPFERF